MIAVCIVGSGPSGFFAADAILRKMPDAGIDILDRLPTPFGLVRGGVAPDHQGTKSIARQFERVCLKPNVRFLGGVTLGRDVSYEELKQVYDVVILALGCAEDRTLGVPGERLPGVYGSAAFVGWYNGHPDHRDLAPLLDRSAVAIVGNGNVALDVARVLAKTTVEMASSDLCRHAAEAIAAAPLTDIHVIGRRGPAQASFTPAELAELGTLERAEPMVDPACLADVRDAAGDRVREKNIEILRGFASRGTAGKPVRIHLAFHAAPQAVLGTDRVAGIRLARTHIGQATATGETFDLPVGAVVSCIGYRSQPIPGLPFDEARGIIRNDDGAVEPGVYAVGWGKRGPSGTIPTNRADSIAVVGKSLRAIKTGEAAKEGGGALDRMLAARGVTPVTFADWQRISAAEVARAPAGRPREKFTRIEEMVSISGSGRTDGAR